MARAVLGLRPDVEQDDFAERESLFELGGRELFDPLAEIVAGKDGDLRDVAGGESVKQCIEQKSVGITASAGDEPDVDSYAITLSLRLP